MDFDLKNTMSNLFTKYVFRKVKSFLVEIRFKCSQITLQYQYGRVSGFLIF
jgi:hypothetical protein